MPIGKDIYKQLSAKFDQKKKRVKKLQGLHSRQGAPTPPKVPKATRSTVVRAMSNNIHVANVVGKPRAISPTEGMPAVNGKSGPEIVKKAVRKPKSRIAKVDPTAGAIKSAQKKVRKKRNNFLSPRRWNYYERS